MKKAYVLSHDVVVKADGHSPACGSQKGHDAPCSGYISHADKKAFAEPGLFVSLSVKRIDSHKKWKYSCGDRGVCHYVGHGCCHYKAAKIDHTGFFSHNSKHLICQTLGQACLGKDHADDY